MGLFHSKKIDLSVWLSHFASISFIYEQLSSCDCSVLSQNISQCEIFGHAKYRIWWKHIDTICPTVSGSPHSILCWLHRQSSTCFLDVSLTFMLAESIRQHLVEHSQRWDLGFRNPWCHCLTLCWIHHLPHSCLRSHLDCPNHNFSQDNFRCWKYFLVHYPYAFGLEDGRFFSFGRHSIDELILQQGNLQTMQVAMVISLTIWMEPHHHAKSLTRTCCWSLQYVTCIIWQSFACFEHEIPLV